MFKTVLVATCASAVFAVTAAPASATGIFIGDFKKFEGDPQYDAFVRGYLEGLVEGEISGVTLETRARGGGIKEIRAFCIKLDDHYEVDQSLSDVRAYLAAHPETPDDWTVSTVMAAILVQRYPCR